MPESCLEFARFDSRTAEGNRVPFGIIEDLVRLFARHIVLIVSGQKLSAPVISSIMN